MKPVDVKNEEDWFDDSPLLNRQVGFIAFTLFILFQILLVTKLDGEFHGIDWLVVMVPYYLFELAEVIYTLFFF